MVGDSLQILERIHQYRLADYNFSVQAFSANFKQVVMYHMVVIINFFFVVQAFLIVVFVFIIEIVFGCMEHLFYKPTHFQNARFCAFQSQDGGSRKEIFVQLFNEIEIGSFGGDDFFNQFLNVLIDEKY